MTDPFRHRFQTRWNDNDQYGHLNNTIYYTAMDSTITTWMIEESGVDPLTGGTLAFCVSSSCNFVASASFPDELWVDLSVGRLGSTSVSWKLDILRAEDTSVVAHGTFVHVFVDAETRRPVPILEVLRASITAALPVAE